MSDRVELPAPSDLLALPSVSKLRDVDRRFVERVYATSAERYVNRLHNAGLRDRARVLDLGCGFGQWTMCLAQLNRTVVAVDPSPARTGALAEIAEFCGLANVEIATAGAEEVPVDDASVDGVFCFGVAQYVAPECLMGELARVLARGACAYVNGKDIGGYVFDWLEGRHRASDFEPRQVTVDAFRNSLALERTGRVPDDCEWTDRIVPMEALAGAARTQGLEVVGQGEEGSLCSEGMERRDSAPFFPGSYRGLPNAYEILVRRP